MVVFIDIMVALFFVGLNVLMWSAIYVLFTDYITTREEEDANTNPERGGEGIVRGAVANSMGKP